MNGLMKSKGRIINFKSKRGLIILPFLFIILFFVRLSVIVGVSMEPTLLDGHRTMALVNITRFYEPKINDLVLVKKKAYDDKILVKRVVGVPGDVIEIRNNKLYRNGILVEEDYIKEEMITNNLVAKLSDDEIFILGDNRNKSLDSRIPTIGIVKIKDEVIGKVIFNLSTFKFM